MQLRVLPDLWTAKSTKRGGMHDAGSFTCSGGGEGFGVVPKIVSEFEMKDHV